MTSKPYIVLLGDAGTGKSTIVEKLTEEKGRKSVPNKSVTVTSDVFEIYDGSFIICDTPGNNLYEGEFQSNLHIAHGLNFSPVTCIMIIVKADKMMKNVIASLREYTERFLPEDLPFELIGVCVTHMDTVTWTKDELLLHLKEQLGIETAVFCSLNKTGTTLRNDILVECSKRNPIKLSIDSEMFLRLFNVYDNSSKILRDARKEIARFEKIKQVFFQQKRGYGEKDQIDMIFEFQTWMLEEIIEAQKRLANNNNFQFIEGPNMASEAGHVANMTNQLRKVLSDVRLEAMKYQKDIDTDFRKCPFCSTIWQLVEGDDGPTICGNRVSNDMQYDVWSGDYGVMSTFQFFWDVAKETLIIKKQQPDGKTESHLLKRNGNGAGCGKDIEWSKMAPVMLTVEFEVNPSSTKDVIPIPSAACATWNEFYNKSISRLPKLVLNKTKREDGSRNGKTKESKKPPVENATWNDSFKSALSRLPKLEVKKTTQI